SSNGRPIPSLAHESDNPWPSLYQWFATREDAAVERLRQTTWTALSYVNTAKLSAEIARSLFPEPLRASVAQMETFAACPFRHFLRYGMQLSGRQRPNVTAQDLGRLYHELLETLVANALRCRDAAGDAADDA